jgi:hypothetical protein
MKIILYWTIVVSVPINANKATPDSTVSVKGKIQIATAGFASVPAFSFKHPFVNFLSGSSSCLDKFLQEIILSGIQD